MHTRSWRVRVRCLAPTASLASCFDMNNEHPKAGSAHDRGGEHALRESEHRLQLALAAGDLGAFDLDVTRGITFMSPRVYSIFGYEPGDPNVPPNIRMCLRKPLRSEQLFDAVSQVLAGGSR